MTSIRKTKKRLKREIVGLVIQHKLCCLYDYISMPDDLRQYMNQRKQELQQLKRKER